MAPQPVTVNNLLINPSAPATSNPAVYWQLLENNSFNTDALQYGQRSIKVDKILEYFDFSSTPVESVDALTESLINAEILTSEEVNNYRDQITPDVLQWFKVPANFLFFLRYMPSKDIGKVCSPLHHVLSTEQMEVARALAMLEGDMGASLEIKEHDDQENTLLKLVIDKHYEAQCSGANELAEQWRNVFNCLLVKGATLKGLSLFSVLLHQVDFALSILTLRIDRITPHYLNSLHQGKTLLMLAIEQGFEASLAEKYEQAQKYFNVAKLLLGREVSASGTLYQQAFLLDLACAVSNKIDTNAVIEALIKLGSLSSFSSSVDPLQRITIREMRSQYKKTLENKLKGGLLKVPESLESVEHYEAYYELQRLEHYDGYLLELAVKQGAVSRVQCLLKLGKRGEISASTMPKAIRQGIQHDQQGESARAQDYWEIANLLLAANPDYHESILFETVSDIQLLEGNTALHIWASNHGGRKYPLVGGALLKLKCIRSNINATNIAGETALDIAYKLKDKAAQEMLTEKGAYYNDQSYQVKAWRFIQQIFGVIQTVICMPFQGIIRLIQSMRSLFASA